MVLIFIMIGKVNLRCLTFECLGGCTFLLNNCLSCAGTQVSFSYFMGFRKLHLGYDEQFILFQSQQWL